MSGVIRVGVLDEHEVVRYGLHTHLAEQSGISVAGVYDQVGAVWRALEHNLIDLLVMSHALQKTDALNLVKAIRHDCPQLKQLLIVDEADPKVALSLRAGGAHGVVCKREPLDVLIQAVRAVAAGERYLSPSIVAAQAYSPIPAWWDCSDAAEVLAAHPALSLREREVLRLCISGLTVTRIAEISHRSLKTVSTQKLAAYRKLGVKSDMDLFKRLSQPGGFDGI
ncbi:LuxR C-terminal-related transcriptional regulator [Pseudomonas lactucae]|uniref:LuxR C-terminal-related transcriptional regulator n=1 Tax=Pseudomonas lactucae TaxID=2813360 RepID=UPI0001E977E4|nr:capsula synthesis response regulator transcription regulator protein [Pseudomonas fluorescens WH6]